jgi:hypothetical protein
MAQTATAPELIARSLQKRLKDELKCRSAYSERLNKLYVHDMTVSCYLAFHKDTVSLCILSDSGKYGKRLFNVVKLGTIAAADNIANPAFSPEVYAEKLFEVLRHIKGIPDELKKLFDFDYVAFRVGANKVRLGD